MYETTGNASAYAVRKQFNAEKAEVSPWMLEVFHGVGKNAAADVGDAFVRFFKGQNKYPKFKKKSREGAPTGSFKANNNIHELAVVDRGNPRRPGLRIPLPRGMSVSEFGSIKMAEQLRWPEGDLRSGVISCNASGQWFVSLLVQLSVSQFKILERENQATGGLDLGCRHLGVESDGTMHENRSTMEAEYKSLARLQRKLARQHRGSNSWEDTRLRIAKKEDHIKNIRTDSTHKMTTSVVKKYVRLGIERLNVAGMVRNKKLAARIQDANFGAARAQVVYKSHLYGTELVSASTWFPSSKRCVDCGHVNNSLGAEELWVCSECATSHHRDVSSARGLADLADAVMADISNNKIGLVRPESTRVESTALLAHNASNNQTSVKPESGDSCQL